MIHYVLLAATLHVGVLEECQKAEGEEPSVCEIGLLHRLVVETDERQICEVMLKVARQERDAALQVAEHPVVDTNINFGLPTWALVLGGVVVGFAGGVAVGVVAAR